MSRSAERALLLALALGPAGALAQSHDSLDNFLRGTVGREFLVDGLVGTGLDPDRPDAPMLQTEDGRAFPLILDPAAAAEIAGACSFAAGDGQAPCRAAGVVALDWDGAELVLVGGGLRVEPPAP